MQAPAALHLWPPSMPDACLSHTAAGAVQTPPPSRAPPSSSHLCQRVRPIDWPRAEPPQGGGCGGGPQADGGGTRVKQVHQLSLMPHRQACSSGRCRSDSEKEADAAASEPPHPMPSLLCNGYHVAASKPPLLPCRPPPHRWSSCCCKQTTPVSSFPPPPSLTAVAKGQLVLVAGDHRQMAADVVEGMRD